MKLVTIILWGGGETSNHHSIHVYCFLSYDWLIHTSDNSICYLCFNNKKYYIIIKVLKSGIFLVLYYK